MRRAKLFIINAGILTVTSIVMNAINVSFGVYISNKIGTEAIGVYSLLQSVFMFAITLALSGMNLASTRIVAEEIALDHQNGAKKAVKKCLWYSMLYGLSAGILLFLLRDVVATQVLHGRVSTTPVIILACSLPFLALSSVMNGYFSAVRRVIKSSTAKLLEEFVDILICVYLLSLFMPSGLEYACIALVIGTTLSEMVSCLYLFILYLWDKRKVAGTDVPQKSYTKRIFGISFPIAITSYIRSGLSTLKQIMIPLRLEKSRHGM